MHTPSYQGMHISKVRDNFVEPVFSSRLVDPRDLAQAVSLCGKYLTGTETDFDADFLIFHFIGYFLCI